MLIYSEFPASSQEKDCYYQKNHSIIKKIMEKSKSKNLREWRTEWSS